MSNQPKTTTREVQPSNESKGLPKTSIVATGWEGPLPPPWHLEKYGQIVKDGAERVFRQFELEADHRRHMQTRSLRLQARDLLVGKCFALVFVLGMITISAYAIYANQPVLAGVLGSGVLGTVVWAFVRVIGDSSQSEDR
jgi:uncharacterized membrane protein